jgi:Tfp pilus assembly PilM family ATPase
MSPLPAWLETPPPTLALAIDARGVAAVVARPGGSSPVLDAASRVALPAGAVQASLTGPNVLQPEPVIAAVRQAVGQVSGRHRRCALVLPDTVARVSLLRFAHLPAQARDLEQLVRLQLRKALPFPVEQAQLAIVPGHTGGAGHELVVVAARRDVIEAYEQVCAEAGLHAGTVDLATLNIVNAVLLTNAAAARGDWLLVHVGADCSSLAIVRDGYVIFFRTRPADADEPLADVVHQTRMYFEDRLAGQGFARVLLAGGGAAAERSRLTAELSERLGIVVEPVRLGREVAGSVQAGGSEAGGDLAAPYGVVARAM